MILETAQFAAMIAVIHFLYWHDVSTMIVVISAVGD